MLCDHEFIIIGKQSIRPERFRPIINVPHIPKPDGGLWASMYTPGNIYVSAWHQWCVENCFERGVADDCIIFKLSKNVKPYIIDSQNDLIKLVKKVGKQRSLLHVNGVDVGFSIIPDFEAAALEYDCIYLTHNGQRETHLPLVNYKYNLYGWDCESLLLFNLDIIETWTHKRLDLVDTKEKKAL